MVKTMAVVAPLVLHLPAEEIASKHLADTGVLGGLSPVRLQRICLTVSTVLLPEYLGFCRKRFADHFRPGCHLYWRCAVLHLAPIGSAIQTFSQWAAYRTR